MDFIEVYLIIFERKDQIVQKNVKYLELPVLHVDLECNLND